MSRSIHQRHVAPQTVQELADALVQVWEEIPQETIRHLIRSMPRRCREPNSNWLTFHSHSSLNLGLLASSLNPADGPPGVTFLVQPREGLWTSKRSRRLGHLGCLRCPSIIVGLLRGPTFAARFLWGLSACLPRGSASSCLPRVSIFAVGPPEGSSLCLRGSASTIGLLKGERGFGFVFATGLQRGSASAVGLLRGSASANFTAAGCPKGSASVSSPEGSAYAISCQLRASAPIAGPLTVPAPASGLVPASCLLGNLPILQDTPPEGSCSDSAPALRFFVDTCSRIPPPDPLRPP
ncbi:hypothetical protein L3Q82_000634 [Scortum barcoo]|uniref:Uncharacterized protein n=1 Tax=Scortum barcoo TaxID=214431 RepID=A0ACB8WFC7_9TELE|nr:hypothetical protein L3Q82_000634 [Scortum barcoo]